MDTQMLNSNYLSIISIYDKFMTAKTKIEKEKLAEKAIQSIKNDFKEWDSNSDKGMLKIFEVNGFKELLNKKAKKIYNTPSYSTVYELSVFKNKLFRIDSNSVLYNLFTYKKDFIAKCLFLKRYRELYLTRYISIQIDYKTFSDIEDKLPLLAKLFNYLANKEIIKYATLCPLIILPLAKIDTFNRCILSIFPVLNSKDCKSVKEINDKIGFELFSEEGQFIQKFDWNLIDKLC